jgi:dihydropteroate synthase
MQFSELLSGEKPLIMGVLNVTPDSFSDGGEYFDISKALRRAEEMIEQGADLIDVGAESSTPNSPEVPMEEEWRRLENILPELQKRKIPFSVDTWKAEIAKRALENGAIIINDVTGLRGDPEMVSVLRNYPEAGIVIMYAKDESARTTFLDIQVEDIVQKISSFFEERLKFCEEQGIKRSRIILDPGMGAFLSSDPEKSFEVLRRLEEFQKFDCPILVGTSRKSFLRNVSDPKNPKNRLIASVVSTLIAYQNGARILRVHDVKETKEGIETWNEVV